MVETNQQSVYHKSAGRRGRGDDFLLHQSNDEILRRKDSGPSKNIFCSFGLFFCRASVACEGKGKHTAIVQMGVFTSNDGVNENKVCNMLLPAYLKGVVLALV